MSQSAIASFEALTCAGPGRVRRSTFIAWSFRYQGLYRLTGRGSIPPGSGAWRPGWGRCRPMRYISTRGHAPARDFAGVLLAGLAEDGGLFMPETWPVFSTADWRAMRGLSY